MKKFLVLGAAVSAVLASPALAGERVSFGAIVGVDSVQLENDPTEVEGSESGAMYGLTAGYDFIDDAGFIMGIELEASDSSVKEDFADVLEAGDEIGLSAGRDLYAGARVGYLFSPQLLAYVKGGYSNGRIKASYSDSTGDYSANEDLDGFRVGAGLEYDFTAFRVRGEYRYTDYGTYLGDLVEGGVDVSRDQYIVSAVFGF
ncbi:MAG: hypothetical protein CL949_04535 [Erythrobacter sp.]|nr:hypothetical protein [Erythrobacter sp.]